jgi:hypothetical protein
MICVFMLSVCVPIHWILVQYIVHAVVWKDTQSNSTYIKRSEEIYTFGCR